MGLDDGITIPQEVAEAGVGESQKTEIITKEAADAKTAEMGDAYSSLMDRMEQSRTEQGDYFIPVTVGYDTDEYDDRDLPKDERDNRVFILRSAAIDRVNDKYVIGVSRKGIFSVSNNNNIKMGRSPYDGEGVEEQIAEIVEKGIPLKLLPEGNLHSDSESEHVSMKIHKWADLKPDKTPDDARTLELWRSAAERSIAAAEVPHRARYETAQREIALAKSAADIIGKLPPRE